jgi:hypothetical protein
MTDRYIHRQVKNNSTGKPAMKFYRLKNKYEAPAKTKFKKCPGLEQEAEDLLDEDDDSWLDDSHDDEVEGYIQSQASYKRP